ncbi:MAG: hypothetical protein JWQ96_1588 [Segetibacter sp.]|nr:hypothetical protein [Segetibacter sp.]
MKNFKWFFAAFTLIAINAGAQSVDDIQKRYPQDHAVILNMNRETRIFYKNGEPVAESKTETEILVLDDKANGIYNKYKVFHGSFDELKNLEAYTKVPDGSKYKRIKVETMKTQSSRSSGVFFDDSKETVFDFPAMMKGAIATVSHTEYHKDAHLLSPFYFSSYLPIINAKFTVSYPADMQLKYILKNNAEGKIQMKEEKKGRQVVYEFTASDSKSKDNYGDAPARSYFEPHVIVHIASFKNDNGNQNFLSSVDDLYKWNYNFLKSVNTTTDPLLKHLSDSLTAGASSEKEKAKRIYQWVQANIKYVAFEEGLEGFVPRQAIDVCNKKYGDCKDMAGLLTTLMRVAGLKAYYTWIGTRDIPYEYAEVPLPITDNHMISTVNIGNEWIFLDGTDPNCIFGFPSKGIQGKQSLVGINETEYKVLRVPEQPAETNVVVDTTFISISSNSVKGRSNVYYNGYFGSDAFNSLLYRDSKEAKDYVKARISKGSNKFILGDYNIDYFNRNEKVINIKANFEVPDYAKNIANEMYINLNLDKSFSTSIIDTAKRKVAVDKDFKYSIKQCTILDMPEGYKVNYLPENYNFSNDLFSFSLLYSQKDNKVIATKEFVSKTILLETKDFQKWNNGINELTNQYKKQIVLQKKVP